MRQPGHVQTTARRTHLFNNGAARSWLREGRSQLLGYRSYFTAPRFSSRVAPPSTTARHHLKWETPDISVGRPCYITTATDMAKRPKAALNITVIVFSFLIFIGRGDQPCQVRSEERRVGKECRSL